MKHLAMMEGLLRHATLGWNDLLASERVVILAEAGSGKTYDLQAQAAKLNAAGKLAFFVPLEALNGEGLRDTLAMNASDLERFDMWRADGASTAWLFLDSVDELKLTQGTLDRALGKVSRDVGAARGRLRVILTCRPTDWRPVQDKQTLLKWLPTSDPAAPAGPSLDSEEGFLSHLSRDESQETKANKDAKPAPKLRFASLLPLSRAQIMTFAEAKGVSDPQALYEEIERQDALPFARRPLDLGRLARAWVNTGSLGTLRQQHESDIEDALSDRPDRPDAGLLSADQARDGAERLALALALTRRRAVREPDGVSLIESDDETLVPAQILKDWTPAQVGALLRRPIFDPATYDRSQFHHRSVQEYLAAQRLLKLRKHKLPARQLYRLLFDERYGDKVVIPSMAPIAAWVAAQDEVVAREVLARQPEILVLHGDPSTLPLQVRRDLIHAIVDQYGPGEWRGLDVPITEARRLASTEMVPTILDCWAKAGTNDEVRDFLLRLALAGGLHECVDIAFEAAFDADRGPYTRNLAVQVVAQAGRIDLMRRITDDMLSHPERWPDRVLIYSSDDLFPLAMTASELLTFIKRVPQPRNPTDGFAYSLLTAARKLDPKAATTVELRDLLVGTVWDTRNTQDRHQPSSTYGYLSAAVTVLCLAQARAGLIDDGLLRAAIISRRINGRNTLGREESVELYDLLRSQTQLRKRFFELEFEITAGFGTSGNAWSRLYTAFYESSLIGGAIEPADWDILLELLHAAGTDRDREALIDGLARLFAERGRTDSDRAALNAAVADYPTAVAILPAKLDPPVQAVSDESRRYQREEKRYAQRRAKQDAAERSAWLQFRADLLADPDGQFTDQKREASTNILLQWLRPRSNDSGHLGLSNWRAVRQSLGDTVGYHFAAALRDYWRTHEPPLRSGRKPDEHNTIFGSQTIGLTGLLVEAGTVHQWAQALTPELARRAAAWATVDLNSAPEWIDALCEAWPEIVSEVFANEIHAELGETHTAAHPHVLSGVEYGTDKLKGAMAQTCRELLLAWPAPPADPEALGRFAENIGRALSILNAANGMNAEIEALCAERFQAEYNLPSGTPWLRGLFNAGSRIGLDALDAKLASVSDEDRLHYGVSWLGALFGDRMGRELVKLSGDAEDVIRLTRLAYQCIKRERDISHDDVYSPGPRDYAQDARNRLINMLIELPGREAHDGLLALAEETIFSHMPDRLRRLARERSANDSEPAPWSAASVVAWERQYELAPETPEALFMLIGDRLDDLAFETREHDFNVRSYLQKIDDETELQLHIAAALDRTKGEFYHLERETEAADKKETDIRIIARAFSGKGVVEVKVGDKPSYSVNSLKLTLSEQIIGKYLRHPDCNVGYLLITYAGRKGYQHPEDGTPIQIEEVIDLLEAHARELEALHQGRIRLGVKLLDLRNPLAG